MLHVSIFDKVMICILISHSRLDDWEAKQPEWQRTRLVLDSVKERLSKGEAPYKNLLLNGSSGMILILYCINHWNFLILLCIFGEYFANIKQN